MRNGNAMTFRGLQDRLVLVRDDLDAVQFETQTHQTSSCGKKRSTHRTGLGAAWPRPQIDASAMAMPRSLSSGKSHFGFCISATDFTVPARQGVHFPHDSCAKNSMRFNAASFTRSRFERTTIAALPIKLLNSASTSKSRGASARDAGRIPPDAPPGRNA